MKRASILSLQKSAFELYTPSPLGVEELAGCDEELMGHCLKCGRGNVKVLGGGSWGGGLTVTCTACCSAAGNCPV